MEFVYILSLSLASIFNSIGPSSQSDRLRNTDLSPSTSRNIPLSSRRSPDTTLSLAIPRSSPTSPRVALPSPRPVAEPISLLVPGPSSRPAVHHSRSSANIASSSRNSPDTTLTLAFPDSAERTRSRSPTIIRPRSRTAFGFPINELPFLRLIYHRNAFWNFEIRKYTFPTYGILLYIPKNQTYTPVPVGEQIVLSNSRGHAFAFVEETEDRTIAYRLHTRNGKNHMLVKVNMIIGLILGLSSTEIESCPLEDQTLISKKFEIFHTEKSVRMRPSRFPTDLRI